MPPLLLIYYVDAAIGFSRIDTITLLMDTITLSMLRHAFLRAAP